MSHKLRLGSLLLLLTFSGSFALLKSRGNLDKTFGAQRMTPVVFIQQQELADTFTRIRLLPVQIDVTPLGLLIIPQQLRLKTASTRLINQDNSESYCLIKQKIG
ncbi:hypothetical protein Xcab_03781 [Xenorhabdus cabanillasii JM26]|nr:hypothetical protein Xcab_03781 [Xenorhabdus cabanillasii JM26]